jgi:hypothetical protein
MTVHRLFAGALDRAEAVADRLRVDRRETVFGGIHVRASRIRRPLAIASS